MAAAPTPAFVEHCLELLAPLGPTRARRMFGGWGLYAQDLFVALIADDHLYLKADDTTEAAFAAAGCRRFDYQTEARTVAMRFWSPPADAMDSPALMEPWARLALAAALRTRAAAARPRPAARPPGARPRPKPARR